MIPFPSKLRGVFRRLWFLPLGLFAFGASAQADPVAASGPEEVEFANLSHGVAAAVGIGTSMVGDDLILEVRAETLGIRSFEQRRWLFQWDAFLGGTAGYLANEHPYTPILGGHLSGDGEIGYRFQPSNPWSLYVGGRLNGSLQVLTTPGVAFSALGTLNNIDGFGGVTASGGLRLDVGGSFLDSAHSLLVVGFVQEALQAPQLHASGAAFTEGGLSARFDITQTFTAFFEALAGVTPSVPNDPLHLTDQTIHEEIAAQVRKTFTNGMWLGGSVSLARNLDRTTYSPGSVTYATGDASSFGFTVVFGIPLGRQQ